MPWTLAAGEAGEVDASSDNEGADQQTAPVSTPGSIDLKVIDTHAAGEPARVVVGGLPDIPGTSMAEKRLYIMEHADYFRKILLQEPRGCVFLLSSGDHACSFIKTVSFLLGL